MDVGSPSEEVMLVRWPDEAGRRQVLASANRPRLLLVDPTVAPPVASDCLEDWVRVPSPEADLDSRLAALAARAADHRLAVPVVDADGVLRFGAAWAALSPLESRLARALIERFAAVVSRDALARAGWPEGPTGRNALDVHVMRLRRRVEPLSLAIRTVRSRGYAMEPAT